MNAPRMDSWLPPWPAYGLPMASPWPPHGSPSARLLQSPWGMLLSQLPYRSCPTSSLVSSEVGAGIPIVHVSLPPLYLPHHVRMHFLSPFSVVLGSSLSWPSDFYLLEAFPPGSISAVDCLTAGPLQPPRTQGSPCEARAPWQGHLDLQLRL